VLILSIISASLLSLLASALKKPQEEAKELDRMKELLVSARIYNPAGYFQILEGGQYVPARYSKDGMLAAGSRQDKATSSEILEVERTRIRPFFVDDEGRGFTAEEKKIDINEYLAANKKTGYGTLPSKLVYAILPNGGKGDPEGYIIPVGGFGLWDAIYGYIALAPDGNDVIGVSWYEQKETPGLGGVIGDYLWQKNFWGKKIFQPDSSGSTDFKRAPLGITIIKGKVKDALGDAPKAKNAVDGIAGATLTGNGVVRTYKDSLAPYRPFFIRLQNKEKVFP
jgi:Na+-transporting NADH:ubiquinone oxidoreductase subunit C